MKFTSAERQAHVPRFRPGAFREWCDADASLRCATKKEHSAASRSYCTLADTKPLLVALAHARKQASMHARILKTVKARAGAHTTIIFSAQSSTLLFEVLPTPSTRQRLLVRIALCVGWHGRDAHLGAWTCVRRRLCSLATTVRLELRMARAFPKQAHCTCSSFCNSNWWLRCISSNAARSSCSPASQPKSKTSESAA